MTTLLEILAEFREAARSNREMGDKFERLIANYLLTDPQYADRLAEVWLWSEWPDRSGMDVGIDLVARERGTGDYWAIQCKFYDPDYALQKAEFVAKTNGMKLGALRSLKEEEPVFGHTIRSETDELMDSTIVSATVEMVWELE